MSPQQPCRDRRSLQTRHRLHIPDARFVDGPDDVAWIADAATAVVDAAAPHDVVHTTETEDERRIECHKAEPRAGRERCAPTSIAKRHGIHAGTSVTRPRAA